MDHGAPRGSGSIVGLDIGATKVSAGLVDERGHVSRHSGVLLHDNSSPEAVLAVAVDAIERVNGPRSTPTSIGVGVAAQVDPVTGDAWYAPNLKWADVALSQRLKDRFRCPVVVSNDARSAAVGEWRFGAGVGERNLLTVIVGTGVGGGAVVDGRLLGGASNACGEIGHTVIVSGGRRCHCPARGCLEAYAGGWAIAERAQERVRDDPLGGRRIIEIAGSIGRIDARAVGEAAKEGNRLAESIVQATSGYLASGVAGLVNAFNPARVVLGGGVVEGWPFLVDAVARRARETCQPPAARSVSVARSVLGAEAVLVGAAAIAREAASTPSASQPLLKVSRRSRGV